jgi:hypothetical protein
MPDKAKNYDYTSTERSRRRRARLKAERLQAEKAARAARWAERNAIRAAKGLPRLKTAAESMTDTRARRKAVEMAVRLDSWYSLPFADYFEAKTYLTGLKPDMPEQVIENTLETTRQEAPRRQLHWNRFVVTNGIKAARLKRAIVWQIIEVLYQQDMTHLEAAMKQAEARSDIAIEEGSHPTAQFQERQRVYDMSQIMLREGGALLNVEQLFRTNDNSSNHALI